MVFTILSKLFWQKYRIYNDINYIYSCYNSMSFNKGRSYSKCKSLFFLKEGNISYKQKDDVITVSSAVHHFPVEKYKNSVAFHPV